jgi:hypothetical protein
MISQNNQNYFPRALGRPAAPSLSDESVLFACGETMLKRFHKLRKIIFVVFLLF